MEEKEAEPANVRYARRADVYHLWAFVLWAFVIGTILAIALVGIVPNRYGAWAFLPAALWVAFLFLMLGIWSRYEEALRNLRGVLAQREDAQRALLEQNGYLRTVIGTFKPSQEWVDQLILPVARRVQVAYHQQDLREVMQAEEDYEALVSMAKREGYKIPSSWKVCLGIEEAGVEGRNEPPGQ